VPGTEDHDRLELLMVLVEDYENRHYPIGPPDPIEAIKFRMEQQGLNRKELASLLGTRGRVSEILNGKRGLSLSMIRALSTRLHIPAEVLIQPTKVNATTLPSWTTPQPDVRLGPFSRQNRLGFYLS
jgi:HTH-type transcriptional regulator/antitoxin HigA